MSNLPPFIPRPPQQDLLAHYYDWYSKNPVVEGNKVMSSIGDQSREPQPGIAAYFNGTDNHVGIAATSTNIFHAEFFNQKLAVNLIVKTTQDDNNVQAIWSRGHVDPNRSDGGVVIAKNTDGKLYVHLWAGGVIHVLYSNTVINDGSWYVISVLYNGTLSIWINGIKESELEINLNINSLGAFTSSNIGCTTHPSFGIIRRFEGFVLNVTAISNSSASYSITDDVALEYYKDPINFVFKLPELGIPYTALWHNINFINGAGSVTYNSNLLNSNIHSLNISGTLTNFWYNGSDVPYSPHNKIGYSTDVDGNIIPAKSKTHDVLNNPLTYKGQVAYNAILRNSPYYTFNGTDTTIGFINQDHAWNMTQWRPETKYNYIRFKMKTTQEVGGLWCNSACDDSTTYTGVFILLIDGKLQFRNNGSGGTTFSYHSSKVINDDQWHDVALFWDKDDNNKIIIYIDGVLDTSSEMGITFYNFGNSKLLVIGTWFNDVGSPAFYYEGGMCDLAVGYGDVPLTTEIISRVLSGDYYEDSSINIPMCEGFGDTLYNLKTKDDASIQLSPSGNIFVTGLNGTLTNIWNNTQDVFHHNELYGYNKDGDKFIPGIPNTFVDALGNPISKPPKVFRGSCDVLINGGIESSGIPSDVTDLRLWNKDQLTVSLSNNRIKDVLLYDKKVGITEKVVRYQGVQKIVSQLPNLIYGVSLREITSNFNKPILILQRHSDDELLEIMFNSNGEIPEDIISSFFGEETIYVRNWFSQDARYLNYQQLDKTRQPHILFDYIGGKPVIRFDGVNDYLEATSNYTYRSDQGDLSSYMVFRKNTSLGGVGSFPRGLANAIYGVTNDYVAPAWSLNPMIRNSGSTYLTGNIPANIFIQKYDTENRIISPVRIGVEAMSSSVPTTNFLKGEISEILIFDNFTSVGIEDLTIRNVRNYYGDLPIRTILSTIA